MFILQITALLILILGLSFYFKISLLEAIPTGISILILFLYLLSFGNLLWLSDYAATALVFGGLLFILRNIRNKNHAVFQELKTKLISAENLAVALLLLLLICCTGAKLVTWWDDYNFWATDVKSIFYLNGFAGKYQNVAAEFGDYPPGTQLFKWWFLHFSPSVFREGFMFAGYHVMNFLFLLPLLSFVKKKNFVTVFLGGGILWLFPFCVEAFGAMGCCADLTMAVIYGAFLVAVLDYKQEQKPLYYYGRQALYLMLLVLCKNTGMIWAGFGLLFTLIFHILKPELREKRKWLWLVLTAPVLCEGSWLAFCLYNRRVAKLTGTAVNMVAGKIKLPVYQEQMTKAFLEAFISWPLHREKTFALDLSPLCLFLFLLLVICFLGISKKMEKKWALFTGLFTLFSGLLFYTLNLVSHLTVFAIETQYLEPYGMVSSIERYGAPFTIGTLYMLAYLLLRRDETKRTFLCCCAFVLLTTDYSLAWQSIWGYRNEMPEVIKEREQLMDEQGTTFLTVSAEFAGQNPGRILYLRDIQDISWIRNTMLSFEAAPVSVMYGNVDTGNTPVEELERIIRESHAVYLYIDPLEGETDRLFGSMLTDEKIEFSCFYRIERKENGFQLTRA